MINLFKILLDSWRIIIDVYKELLTSDSVEVEEYSEEYDKQNDILKKINPGKIILSKQNQADIFIHAMKKSMAYIAPNSIILSDDQECIIFTPAGGKL